MSVLNNVAHDSGQSGIAFVHSEFETITGNTTYNNASTGYYSGISVWENRNVSGDTTTQGYRTIIANNISYDNVTKAGGHPTATESSSTTSRTIRPAGLRTTPTRPWYRATWSTGTAAGAYGRMERQRHRRQQHRLPQQHGHPEHRHVARPISNAFSNNNTFVNNIAVADPSVNPNNTAIINGSSGGANKNVVWADNITFNGASGQASVNNDGGNSVPTVANGNMLGVDPKFVQSGVDFHLQGGSPALNAGASGYGLATSGAVNIGAEGVSGTTSVPVDSGTTSVPVDSGTTSAPPAAAPRLLPPAAAPRLLPPAAAPRLLPPAAAPRLLPPAAAPRLLPPAAAPRLLPPAAAPRLLPPAAAPRLLPPAAGLRPLATATAVLTMAPTRGTMLEPSSMMP